MRTRVSALFLASLLQPLVGSATVGAADLRPAKIDVAVHLLFDRSAPSLTQKDAEEVRDFAVSIETHPNPGVAGQSPLIVTTRHKDIVDSVPVGQESRRSRWEVIGKNRLHGT